MTVDLLIKNGTVLDPSQQLKGKYDVVVSEGRITEFYQLGAISAELAPKEILDASDCFVTPGLIDIHTHAFECGTALGINADSVGVQQGVTTIVDAGSTGVDTFEEFVQKVVQKSTTQVLAWINIARDGLRSSLSELADLENLAPQETIEMIRQNELIRGIKVRMSGSVVKESGLRPLLIAKKAAQTADVPLLVHVGNAPPALGEILEVLGKGDVMTHTFHGKAGGIIDSKGELIPQARAALQRGVLFDIGHGSASFSFLTMKRAKELGIKPYSISTDIHKRNLNGPVHSLLLTLSKFLALGFSLEEVIEASTSAPAKMLGLSDKIGTLKIGTVADISVLSIDKGSISFTDSDGNKLVGQQLLQSKYTIRAGKVIKNGNDFKNNSRCS
ncbi:amidohydrolase/deacetylase family metallohydrolase [Desulfitobacterium sp. AusDCA]|uniref:amidohydrolase/deacetylase family metallohydrolase n=1 Tax=Desulfitobacterium sp. AusDCA TaxID=3240383 RepID=UPI003DA6DD16